MKRKAFCTRKNGISDESLCMQCLSNALDEAQYHITFTSLMRFYVYYTTITQRGKINEYFDLCICVRVLSNFFCVRIRLKDLILDGPKNSVFFFCWKFVIIGLKLKLMVSLVIIGRHVF